jgi:hypothetical protein
VGPDGEPWGNLFINALLFDEINLDVLICKISFFFFLIEGFDLSGFPLSGFIRPPCILSQSLTVNLFIKLLSLFHNVVHIDFLKSQTLQTLTKFVEKTIYIYNTKYIQYKSTSCDVSNDIYLAF